MKVSIGGVDYKIRKIKVGEMLPMLPRFETDQANVQRDMVASCVLLNGESLGDSVDDLDWEVYSKLSVKVLEANGFASGLGND